MCQYFFLSFKPAWHTFLNAIVVFLMHRWKRYPHLIWANIYFELFELEWCHCGWSIQSTKRLIWLYATTTGLVCLYWVFPSVLRLSLIDCNNSPNGKLHQGWNKISFRRKRSWFYHITFIHHPIQRLAMWVSLPIMAYITRIHNFL